MNLVGVAFLSGLCALAVWLTLTLSATGISKSEVSNVKSDLLLASSAASFDALSSAVAVPPSKWADILGDSVLSPSLSAVTTSSMGGEFLALYFSASWCPPCKRFLPALKKFHSAAGGRVQIVLMGQDQSPQARESYYEKSEMPWLTVPFGSSLPDVMSSKLGIRGIPSIVVFDRDGNLVSADGVSDILGHPSATEKWSAR